MIRFNIILFYVIPYLIFMALLWLSKEKKGLRLFDEDGYVSNPHLLIGMHIGGIISFGLLQLLTGYLPSYTNFDSDGFIVIPSVITVFFVVVVILFSFWQAKRKFSKTAHKATLNEALGLGYTSAYFLVRIIFICVYENWFRGSLLNDCIYGFGIPLALMINVCMYALLHAVNGREEVLACIPFGLLLCSLCILQNAVWPAIALHLALTITYEIGFIRQMVNHKHAVI